MTIDEATTCALEELGRALAAFPTPFHSDHEGYATLLEELDEYWDEVKDKHSTPQRRKEEVIQVAAMALRILVERY